uniref:Putative e3 ubiquitin ligase n=1 Tax=Lupinus angustifolius TaxID=3871 RepID=A0A182BFE1_LUPAN|nr:putative e3 ubiquitin ligase [Lupinus angustifolius]
MSSRTGRTPVRSYRRRKIVLDIDLNYVPSGENREQEGPSIQLAPQQVQVVQQPQAVQEPPIQLGTGQVQAVRQMQAVQPPTIDVEAFDDDVIESNPRAFAEVVTTIVMQGSFIISRLASPKVIKAPIVDLKWLMKHMPPPEPPKEPVFNCPICMGPLVEEVSTKCGHIFCKACIKAAISAQNKCPTCRKKITVRELIRVFLPSTS